MSDECAGSTYASQRRRKSHARAVWSSDPDATWNPSRCQSKQRTLPEWPWKWWMRLPLRTSQTAIRPAKSPVHTSDPSGCHATP